MSLHQQRTRHPTGGEGSLSDSVDGGGKTSMSSTLSSSSSASNHAQASFKEWPQASAWRDMNARSAPFTIPAGRDATSPTAKFSASTAAHHSSSSPPNSSSTDTVASSSRGGAEASSFQRFATSPPSGSGEARSPSPSSTRGPFSFANSDARERWSSIGSTQHAAPHFGAESGLSAQQLQQHHQQQQQQQHKNALGTSGSFGSEPFLGYSDIWGNNSGNASRSQAVEGNRDRSSISSSANMLGRGQGQSLESINTRLDNMNVGRSAADESGSAYGPASFVNGHARNIGQESLNMNGAFPGSAMSAPDSLSPRAMMHMHQQQQPLHLQQHQHAHQAHQQTSVMQGPPSMGGGPATLVGGMEGVRNGEEITTVFIVGFPDDMGMNSNGGAINASGRPGEASGAGPGGPYSAVNMSVPPMFEHQQQQQQATGAANGGWDEQGMPLAHGRNNAAGDFGGMPSGAMGLAGGPPGKIKQIIGFAKFRTRAEALEARDALNGRKIDAERGCVLKTEMAKKNLHTKQRPVLANATGSEGSSSQGPPFPLSNVGLQGAPGSSMNPPQPHPGFLSTNMSVPQPPPSQNGIQGVPAPQGGIVFGMNSGSHNVHDGGGNGGAGPNASTAMTGNNMTHGTHGGSISLQQQQQPPPPGAFSTYGGGQGQSIVAGQHVHGGNRQTHHDVFPAQHMQHLQGALSPPAEDGSVYGRGPSRSFSTAGTQSSESGHDMGSGASSSNWTGKGPLDYFEGANNLSRQQHPQQPQQVPPIQTGVYPNQAAGNNASARGPDWSTLGSPPDMFAGSKSIAFGELPPQQHPATLQPPAGPQHLVSGRDVPGSHDAELSRHPQQAPQHQDFRKGESTTQEVNKSTSPSLPQQAEGQQGASQRQQNTSESDVEVGVHHHHQQQQQQNQRQRPFIAAPIAAHANDGVSMPPPPPPHASQQSASRPLSRLSNRATSPSISGMNGTNAARFGPLRIDSPMHNQRPFSPHALMRSPPPGLENGGLHFRATSPGSPSISSPTSRSFSIDANPPGNTLFVGNLPASITSPPASTQLEDLLYKAFSAKYGFRQMSFRVKSSGPMCFIEFDDVGCAGRALGELNGDTLEGIVKGGLRLSFSKHPLFKGTTSGASSQHGLTGASTPPSATSNNVTLPNGLVHEQQQQQLPQKQQQAGRNSAKSIVPTLPQNVAPTFEVDEVSRLEESSQREGFDEGYAHGKLHGLFEGRQLGAEKSFELWQELGHIEGVARVWLRSLTASASAGNTADKGVRKRQKQIQQLESLLSLVSEMPMDNANEIDVGASLERIRAKYKLACYSLGIAPDHQTAVASNPIPDASTNSPSPNTTNVTIKGRTVDTSQLHF